MKKIITVNGMNCNHCRMAVERALNAIDGVKAEVNLEAKTATVTMDKDIGDDILKQVIDDAGYEAGSIRNI